MHSPSSRIARRRKARAKRAVSFHLFLIFIQPGFHVPRDIGLAGLPPLNGSGVGAIRGGHITIAQPKTGQPGTKFARRHSRLALWWINWQGLASRIAMVAAERKLQRRADMVGRCYWGLGRSSVRCSWTRSAQSPGGWGSSVNAE